MKTAPRSYRLYIDESGDHTYRNLDETGRRYLGLLGVIINNETYGQTIRPEINELKCRHFGSGAETVFHRVDIMKARGQFSCLQDPHRRSAFDSDLLAQFEALKFGLICVVIDKKAHLSRYPRTAFPPYHYGMKLMLERYCYFLNHFHAVGDVMAEKRGKAEDKLLQEAFRAVHVGGTEQHAAEFFQETLTSDEIDFQAKSANINGLQMADLLAHPVRHGVLEKFEVQPCSDGAFGEAARKAVSSKFNRNFSNGKVVGYGMVLK